MTEIINKLIDSQQFATLTIMMLIVFLLLAGALFIVYTLVGRIHIKKLKIGGNEIEMSEAEKQNAIVMSSAQPKEKTTDMPTFVSTLQQIIDYSVDNGSQASLKRQQLYDSQMRFIHDKFENLRTVIEFEYSEVSLKAQPIVTVLLKYCFNVTILEKLEHICRADRLTEREKDKFIEENRSLINGSYAAVVNELKKYITKSENTTGLGLTYVDEELFTVLSKRKDDISRSITDCLEHSWEEASNYFEELKETRKILSENVTKALKSYFDSTQHELIPTDWYDYDKLPPNETVGVSL